MSTTTSLLPPFRRLRNLRRSAAIRSLVRETTLSPENFVLPLFVREGIDAPEPIEGLPAVYRYPLSHALKEIEEALHCNIPSILLFPYIEKELRSPTASEAIREQNFLYRAIEEIKSHHPSLHLMVDIALDPYTSHGHDGLVDEFGNILNDETVEVLTTMSLLATGAGADTVAPSDMMDGRIAAIRHALESAGYTETCIMAYSAKFASHFYGPFRNALDSAPAFGDKKSYQLDPANAKQALFECENDVAEGADLLLIKPGLAYLDILYRAKQEFPLPIGAYQVSGEYAMIQAAGERGWLNAEEAMLECLLSYKRAGADFLISYAAKEVAKRL